jgi:DNA repair exonuclease SbcCD ATPase subunit
MLRAQKAQLEAQKAALAQLEAKKAQLAQLEAQKAALEAQKSLLDECRAQKALLEKQEHNEFSAFRAHKNALEAQFEAHKAALESQKAVLESQKAALESQKAALEFAELRAKKAALEAQLKADQPVPSPPPSPPSLNMSARHLVGIVEIAWRREFINDDQCVKLIRIIESAFNQQNRFTSQEIQTCMEYVRMVSIDAHWNVRLNERIEILLKKCD